MAIYNISNIKTESGNLTITCSFQFSNRLLTLLFYWTIHVFFTSVCFLCIVLTLIILLTPQIKHVQYAVKKGSNYTLVHPVSVQGIYVTYNKEHTL